ncbi:MAG TPA: sulfatase-like hydrolase/transferase, partial [Planctomycetota bacterium]|nr:sulfatase-like hydrolase/transferase [Planctomycetota bacterium]
ATAGLAPRFDALARSGVVFDRAMAPSSWTVPSTSTLMTGLPPSAHGAVDNDSMVLPGDIPTLAERARAAGVATGAVVANELLRPAAGYARGFESYARIPYCNARQVNDLAAAFLENHSGQQFLLYLHYFDPHGPVNAPGEWRDRYVEPELRHLVVREAEGRLLEALKASMAGRGPAPTPDDPDVRFLRQRYLGEVAYLDALLAELLDGLERLGRDRDTIVVITADHGEEFMDHGMYGHGSQLFDETLHVPLIVLAPEDVRLPWRPGTRVPDLVNTSGLYASILDWLDVPFDPDQVLAGLDQRVAFAISETHKGVANDNRGDPLRRYLACVRTADWRLITSERVEGESGPQVQVLYDLRADPDCQSPLPADAEAQAAVRKELLQLLGEFLDWAKGHRGASPIPGGSLQTIEMLKQMGYTH